MTVILLKTEKQEEVFMDTLYISVEYQLHGKSKGMRSVVLSTREAVYIALSEVVKEIKFIIPLLSTMSMNIEMPITIYVHNVSAIWLSNNRTTSERTKHIHKRTPFVKNIKRKDKS